VFTGQELVVGAEVASGVDEDVSEVLVAVVPVVVSVDVVTSDDVLGTVAATT
jgi:hypothetical protein